MRAVDDCGGVIRHAGDDRDVRGIGLEHNCVAVHNRDRAFGGLVCGGINQRGKAASHRVALDVLFTPASDVACNVFGGEIVTVVPLDALADHQRVFGGVVIGFPCFQQHWLKRTVAVVLHEILQPTGCECGDLRPVIGARILERADFHFHADRAAHLGVCCGLCRALQATQGIGSRGGQTKSGGPGQKFTAVQKALLEFLGVHLRDRMCLLLWGRRCHTCLPVTFIFFSRGSWWLAFSGGTIVCAPGHAPRCASFRTRWRAPSTPGFVLLGPESDISTIQKRHAIVQRSLLVERP